MHHYENIISFDKDLSQYLFIFVIDMSANCIDTSEDILNTNVPNIDIQIQNIKKENREELYNDLDNQLVEPDVDLVIDCPQLLEPKQEIEIGDEELTQISSIDSDFKDIIESEYFTKAEHKGKKCFVCEICTKAFKTRRELTIHGAVHVETIFLLCMSKIIQVKTTSSQSHENSQ